MFFDPIHGAADAAEPGTVLLLERQRSPQRALGEAQELLMEGQSGVLGWKPIKRVRTKIVRNGHFFDVAKG